MVVVAVAATDGDGLRVCCRFGWRPVIARCGGSEWRSGLGGRHYNVWLMVAGRELPQSRAECDVNLWHEKDNNKKTSEKWAQLDPHSGSEFNDFW